MRSHNPFISKYNGLVIYDISHVNHVQACACVAGAWTSIANTNIVGSELNGLKAWAPAFRCLFRRTNCCVCLRNAEFSHLLASLNITV